MSYSPIIPFLRYRDSTKAVQWLVDAFGLETFEVNTDGDGNVVHAELRRGDATLQVGPPSEDGAMAMRSPLDLPFTSQGVYMNVGSPQDGKQIAKDTTKGYNNAQASGWFGSR